MNQRKRAIEEDCKGGTISQSNGYLKACREHSLEPESSSVQCGTFGVSGASKIHDADSLLRAQCQRA